MATQVTNYKCPACTGPLHYAGGSGKLECDYCGSSFEVAEIEALVKEQNDKAAAAQAASENSQWEMGEQSSDWGGPAGMKTYSCPSCGAELICDENTAATCCPYCGNQTVVPGQFAGSLKPEYIIPFKTDKEQAKSALKEHYKGKILLPKSFAADNHIEDIQGVYVPFWMFDCKASGEMEFAATTTTRQVVGDKEIITTRHYDVRRAGNLSFEKVPVDASSRMPDEHMDCIEPFDYGDLREFSMAYMPGFLADRYDVEAEACGKRMEKRCSDSFATEIEKTVVGYDTTTERHRAIAVEKGAVRYAMMPVWMLATRWNDRNFLFAMNGQTGKLVGDLPMDKGKFCAFLGGISVILIALMQLVNSFLLSEPFEGGMMVGVCILLPILIAVVVCAILASQLKSVRPQEAGAYISGPGLTLTQKQDRFLHTTTQTRTIKKSN